jgi:hypothetical protein
VEHLDRLGLLILGVVAAVHLVVLLLVARAVPALSSFAIQTHSRFPTQAAA